MVEEGNPVSEEGVAEEAKGVEVEVEEGVGVAVEEVGVVEVKWTPDLIQMSEGTSVVVRL